VDKYRTKSSIVIVLVMGTTNLDRNQAVRTSLHAHSLSTPTHRRRSAKGGTGGSIPS
jgi:hypothetical protein